MSFPLTTIDFEKLKNISKQAGDAIMKIYSMEDFSAVTDFKADNSPLTLADQHAHEIIAAGLAEQFPDIPVLSEEGKDIPFNERKSWDLFWLVDPLDGTKEFISRNGEFTVNIALIHNQQPAAGIIYVPATGTFYYGSKESGAFKEENNHMLALSVNQRKENFIAVGSRSHSAPEEQELMLRLGVKEFVSKGSSLKFCMVAEGKADLYYRHGPTMEWDTAAGQAIVEAAGGVVLNADKFSFTYNKQSLRNGSFYCLSNQNLKQLI
jgi:3'(2'), 5'-bisphosphate nucleotidase